MKRGRTMKVAKRDGTVEPYSQEKIQHCLAMACEAVRVTPRVASSLARAVTIHLRECAAPGLPTTEYVFRCVRAALEQTDFSPAAKALCEHRRWRDAARGSVRIFDARRPERPGGLWRKARVARTLERRHQLSPRVARILAGELEERVLGLRYQLISTALLGELIRNELRAWGLAAEIKIPAPKNVPTSPATQAGALERN